MATFKVKENDTGPALRATLKDADADPIDLETATEILFIMSTQAQGGTPKVAAAATNLQVGDGSDGSLGKVLYQWTADDTDTATTYLCEFQVTFADGTVITFPNDSYDNVSIVADLNSD